MFPSYKGCESIHYWFYLYQSMSQGDSFNDFNICHDQMLTWHCMWPSHISLTRKYRYSLYIIDRCKGRGDLQAIWTTFVSLIYLVCNPKRLAETLNARLESLKLLKWGVVRDLSVWDYSSLSWNGDIKYVLLLATLCPVNHPCSCSFYSFSVHPLFYNHKALYLALLLTSLLSLIFFLLLYSSIVYCV